MNTYLIKKLHKSIGHNDPVSQPYKTPPTSPYLLNKIKKLISIKIPS